MSMPSSPGYYNHAAVISLSTVNLHESNLDGVNDNDDVGVNGFPYVDVKYIRTNIVFIVVADRLFHKKKMILAAKKISVSV